MTDATLGQEIVAPFRAMHEVGDDQHHHRLLDDIACVIDARGAILVENARSAVGAANIARGRMKGAELLAIERLAAVLAAAKFSVMLQTELERSQVWIDRAMPALKLALEIADELDRQPGVYSVVLNLRKILKEIAPTLFDPSDPPAVVPHQIGGMR